jgi:alkylation response protein AidB-like acyl-CoA dehydrogenase
MRELSFDPCVLPKSVVGLRRRVRRFLSGELAGMPALARSAGWDGFDPALSRKMGAAGFIGITLPREYGGGGGSALDRYVVLEETLVAGAPTGFHWFADRQSGPLLARYGSEAQKRAILPRLCRGELCFCIGMSEPGAGSDLAALRTTATRTDGGWRLNGTKLWTTNAHRADYMIALVRTGRDAPERHAGFSQFLIDLKNTPGISVRPIRDLHDREHFNEVAFTDALLPDEALIGVAGDGWAQVNAELALERSGPERYLSCHVLFGELLRCLRGSRDDHARQLVGAAFARLVALRAMSLSIAGMLAAGRDPDVEAAVMKDLGARFEQSLPGIAQELVAVEPSLDAGDDFVRVLASLTMLAPSFSLRGGSLEILRGIIARGLGLR